jgi:isopentenyldiphosphate isomerase
MQKTILKNIIMATLPIFAYIIADSIFNDSIISLFIAIGLSVLEFAGSFIRYKKVDFFIFFDLILILSMGIMSILLKNPVFFKLKPAIIEMILILFFIPLCASPGFFTGYLNRYLKDFSIPEDKIKVMQQKMAYIIPLFLLHVILIVISAFYFSKEVWGFVSGVLLYITFGVIFAVLFVYKYVAGMIARKKYEKEEWFDIVDEDGRVTGSAPRSVCHNGSKLLHPVVHVHIINSKNLLMLQKRSSLKDIQPGLWDTSVGGHVSSGEKLEDAILREVKEEAGIDIDLKKITPLSRYVFESSIERELSFSFVYKTDDTIRHNAEEIDEVGFFSLNEIKRLIDDGKTTENFIKELSILEASVKKGLITIR